MEMDLKYYFRRFLRHLNTMFQRAGIRTRGTSMWTLFLECSGSVILSASLTLLELSYSS